ncbi:hypothetical protein [Pseudogracilibacillus sp. SO30301A]|uniref:hypothetical protein n=1 Tax=Pseudogracilibacillus sp. SO30301A TaxID=3098291 RepID=UPI00300DEA2C
MSLSLTLIPIAIAASSVVSYALQDKIEEGIYYKIDTNLKDENILTEALKNRGCNVSLDKRQIESTLGNVEIVFQRQEDDTISAVFHKDIPLKDAEEFVKNTHEEYTRIVQQKTYHKLVERAKNEGLILESEKRNEEDTIVLTFQVGE